MRDVRIKRKVEKILRKYGAKANVTVEDGIVFIKGSIASWQEYVEIGKETGKIKGVEGVVNDLEYPGKEKKRKKRGKERVIEKADVVIIGGGVVGCAIARELSKYKLNVILVEKSDDVGGGGATKANNALVHTGIGEKMGTLKQRLCVEGHKMFRKIAEELDVPYEECGMWI
ncbi:MAG TPA: FAD-dependent oxidoreductase, partial [Thermoplasmatales archaeon]|nr:FAD-dependent oxidoreductase [Thermoplasmatales archaeon]